VLAFGYFFFVWYSAYNIFIVSAFWSRCADLFTEEQGRRLFPYMVAGGSLGAIAGSGATAALAERMDTFNLLLIPVGLLQVALFCSRRLATAAVSARSAPEDAAAVASAPVRGTLASGIEGALKSPLVVMIGFYVLFATFCGTCLYNINADLARASYPSRDARTEYFAGIDLWVNVFALTSELVIAPRLISWVGAGTALLLLPSVYAIGLSLAGLNPVIATVAALVVVQRSVAYGLTTPARESLFTVVPREEKYKAKNLIDTFVWRGGDVAAVWLIYAILELTTGEKASAAAKTVVVAATGIPFALAWVLATWRLRRLHRERVLMAETSAPV
jgi:ATP:ADP antiporter, AAA family